LPPAQTGLLTLLDTVLGTLWVGLFVGELPTMKEIIGGAIIIITLTLHTILKRQDSRHVLDKKRLKIIGGQLQGSFPQIN